MNSLFLILFGCLYLMDSAEIKNSKFRLVPGKSPSLDSTNPALIIQVPMNVVKKTDCQKKCLADSNCDVISISWSNSTCYLFTIYGLAQPHIDVEGVDTYFKVSPRLNTGGLVNYWPIHNDYQDYIGGAHLIPYLDIKFANDRFDNRNETLSFVGDGYYKLPDNVYIAGDFTLLAWVRVNQIKADAKIMDLGNPNSQDILEFCLSRGTTSLPYVAYTANGDFCYQVSNKPISVGDWHHLAAVLNGYNMTLYMDGELISSLTCSSLQIPVNVTRTSCMVGRSNWYPGEEDAYADYDELKIYSRALSLEEILYDITFIPN